MLHEKNNYVRSLKICSRGNPSPELTGKIESEKDPAPPENILGDIMHLGVMKLLL